MNIPLSEANLNAGSVLWLHEAAKTQAGLDLNNPDTRKAWVTELGYDTDRGLSLVEGAAPLSTTDLLVFSEAVGVSPQTALEQIGLLALDFEYPAPAWVTERCKWQSLGGFFYRHNSASFFEVTSPTGQITAYVVVSQYEQLGALPDPPHLEVHIEESDTPVVTPEQAASMGHALIEAAKLLGVLTAGEGDK